MSKNPTDKNDPKLGGLGVVIHTIFEIETNRAHLKHFKRYGLEVGISWRKSFLKLLEPQGTNYPLKLRCMPSFRR